MVNQTTRLRTEVLNKVAQQLDHRWADCRVVSCNWGPWDGGMVTPGLKRVFASEGIVPIGLAAGARYLVDQLAVESSPVEVVVFGAGTDVPAETLSAESPSARVSEPHSVDSNEPPHSPPKVPALPVVFEREVSVETHPVLASHVIGEKAVVPVVLVLEWLAHAGLHLSPGLHFVGIDQQRVYAGLTLVAGVVVHLHVGAQTLERVGDEYRVATELRSVDETGASVLHASATVCLSASPPAAGGARIELEQNLRPVEDVYNSALFHGPAFHGLERIGLAADGSVIAQCAAESQPEQWMASPVRRRWIAGPLALDAGLQALIVATFVRCGRHSLPTRIGRYRQFCQTLPRDGLSVVVNLRGHDEHRAQADLEWLAADGTLVARMEECEMVIDASLAQAFAHNRLSDASASPVHL